MGFDRRQITSGCIVRAGSADGRDWAAGWPFLDVHSDVRSDDPMANPSSLWRQGVSSVLSSVARARRLAVRGRDLGRAAPGARGTLLLSPPKTEHGAADVAPRRNIDEAARFLLALPNLRFANSRIPRLIHHTWKVSDASQFPPMVRASVASFRTKNDAVLQLVWSDRACEDLVDARYPSLSRLFRELVHPILRADLFRYMVLQTFGGVYSDVDTLLLKAVDEWVPAPVDSILSRSMHSPQTMMAR